jgi:hypothetical protein
MDYLMILYPIQPYVDALNSYQPPYIKERRCKRFQRLIEYRYPNFQTVLIFFSSDENQNEPDISQQWEGLPLKDEYIIGACGVSFKDHTEKEVYPDPEHILNFCPTPIEQLVICGFHLWDCVDKVASHAWNKGIKVSVDEDLTETFFWRDDIPNSRDEGIKKKREYFNEDSLLLQIAQEKRQPRPWLAQL